MITCDRARKLLVTHLNPEQKRTWFKDGFFDVIGGDSGTLYRVHLGHSNNVEIRHGKPLPLHKRRPFQINPAKRPRKLCFGPHPHSNFPMCDVLLAQKFALELREAEMLRIAR